MRRFVTLFMVLAVLMVLSAGPAWAEQDYEWGTKYCYTTFIGIQSRSIGSVGHYAEGDLLHSWTDAAWTNHGSIAFGVTDGIWGVSTNGAMYHDYPYTYAYCTGIN